MRPKKKEIKNEPVIKELFYTNPENPKDKFLVCRIDKTRKEAEYFLRSNSSQYQWIKSIKIKGFKRLPAGFSTNGGGLLPKRSAYLFVKGLDEKLTTFNFSVLIGLFLHEDNCHKFDFYTKPGWNSAGTSRIGACC